MKVQFRNTWERLPLMLICPLYSLHNEIILERISTNMSIYHCSSLCQGKNTLHTLQCAHFNAECNCPYSSVMLWVNHLKSMQSYSDWSPLSWTIFHLDGSGLFQDDNVSIHSAWGLTEWIDLYENDVNYMLWPSQSPDHNQTECHMDWRVRQLSSPPSSKHHLRKL